MHTTELLQVGDSAPQFTLCNDSGTPISLSDFSGKWIILYFYPKDNTPGCTREAIEFSRERTDLESLGGVVIGISPDSVESHCNFMNSHNLMITLLSDPNREAIDQYGVWQLKKNYGKEYYGVVRSTFLIDPAGKIAKIWRHVRVDGHVTTVKQALEARVAV